MDKKQIAYKFVNWEVGKLEELKSSFPYQLKLKVLKGEKLTKDEKDELYTGLRNNSYSKIGIPLQGYMFDFFQVLNEYFVEDNYGNIFKVFSVDKTSIRNHEKALKRIVKI